MHIYNSARSFTHNMSWRRK